MILVLDDSVERLKKFISNIPSAKTAETADEMIELIKNNSPVDFLFLDHDLGGETYVDSKEHNTGMEVVRWIVANKPSIQKIVVHTCNTDAGFEMEDKLIAAGYDTGYVPYVNIRWEGMEKLLGTVI